MTATPGWGAPTAMAETTARAPVPVLRFSATERWVHWVHAVAFVAMLASGVALYLPAVAGQLGSRQSVKEVHLLAAAGWVVALLVVAGVGNRRALRATAHELDLFDADDRRWLLGKPAPQGRFNAGQKAHAVVQAAAAALFLISGSLLWLGERNTDLRLDGSIVLHDALTVGTVLLVAGHLYLSLVHPPTRPALRGIVRGTVDEGWSRRHHAKWERRTEDRTPPARPAWALLAAAAAVAAGALVLIPSS